MLKYTKKQQKFISDYYGYDLENLMECIEYATAEQQEKLNKVVKLAKALIRADTSRNYLKSQSRLKMKFLRYGTIFVSYLTKISCRLIKKNTLRILAS